MPNFEIKTSVEREVVEAALSNYFDFINDTCLDGVTLNHIQNMMDGTSPEQQNHYVNKLRTELDSNIERLIQITILRERLKHFSV